MKKYFTNFKRKLHRTYCYIDPYCLLSLIMVRWRLICSSPFSHCNCLCFFFGSGCWLLSCPWLRFSTVSVVVWIFVFPSVSLTVYCCWFWFLNCRGWVLLLHLEEPWRVVVIILSLLLTLLQSKRFSFVLSTLKYIECNFIKKPKYDIWWCFVWMFKVSSIFWLYMVTRLAKWNGPLVTKGPRLWLASYIDKNVSSQITFNFEEADDEHSFAILGLLAIPRYTEECEYLDVCGFCLPCHLFTVKTPSSWHQYAFYRTI